MVVVVVFSAVVVAIVMSIYRVVHVGASTFLNTCAHFLRLFAFAADLFSRLADFTHAIEADANAAGTAKAAARAHAAAQAQVAQIEQIRAAEAALSRVTGQQAAAAAAALAAAASEFSQQHAAFAANIHQDRQVVDAAVQFKSALQSKIAGGSVTPMELSILMVRWQCG